MVSFVLFRIFFLFVSFLVFRQIVINKTEIKLLQVLRWMCSFCISLIL